jgi:hypothetical protein
MNVLAPNCAAFLQFRGAWLTLTKCTLFTGKLNKIKTILSINRREKNPVEGYCEVREP